MVAALSTNERLERAIQIAVEAHKGQLDKSGKPYILHPLRVMLRMSTPEQMMAAVLHDVVEDTPWTLDQLRDEGLPENVLEAVDCLSHREGESYDQFVERLLPHPIARKVKLADLEDNMDIRRLSGTLSAKDIERINKYLKYWNIVMQAQE
jgi:(p)ppGpp synthase/HD superfamily hydrolase